MESVSEKEEFLESGWLFMIVVFVRQNILRQCFVVYVGISRFECVNVLNDESRTHKQNGSGEILNGDTILGPSTAYTESENIFRGFGSCCLASRRTRTVYTDGKR